MLQIILKRNIKLRKKKKERGIGKLHSKEGI